MGERVSRVLLTMVCVLGVSATNASADVGSAIAPAGSGDAAHPDCKVCHSGTRTGPDGRSTMPDASVCLACHERVVGQTQAFLRASNRSDSRGSAHVRIDPRMDERVPPGGSEPIRSLDCLSCHSPHANGQPHQLRVTDEAERAGWNTDAVDPISRSCLRCHGGFLQTGRQGADYTLHPIGVPAPTMRLRRDGPSLPLTDVMGTLGPEDDVLACTTCHMVHGSPNPDLLRWSQEEFVAACTTCHRAGGSQAPAPDLLAVDRLSR